MPRLLIDVCGRPAPQGSKMSFGRNFVEVSAYLPAWRTAVITAATTAIRAADWRTLNEPVRVDIDFYINRPVVPQFDRPATPPDIDKLLRSTFDALTMARVFKDDARIVSVLCESWYTHPERRTVPGAEILIEPASGVGAGS